MPQLVLCVHTVDQVTAKVPFAVILLQDFVSQKKVPAEFKCRQVVPTSGSKSTSLWDVSDPEELLLWLRENINVEVTHEAYEVQEEFAIGLGEITRTRAAEKTGKALVSAASAVGQQVSEVDHKLKISERTSAAVGAVRESAVGKGTASVLTKAGSSVKAATTKVMENETVHSATEAVGSGFRKLGQSLSRAIGRRPSSAGDLQPEPVDGISQEPSAADAVPAPIPGTAAAGATAAVSTSPPATAAKFTLDDGDHSSPRRVE